MTATASTVFLLDVDNTLLDNDRFAADLRAYLTYQFGQAECERYWSVYEQLRDTVGYADYLGALQHFRRENDARPELLALSAWLLNYPFENLLFANALETIKHLNTLGSAVILSDGDMVFQPYKIESSGIYGAVGGRVLIFVHKERALDAMQARYPAEHYVMVDDKPQLLAAMKRQLGDRLTTVFVRQGHYAAQADLAAIQPAPDHSIEEIGDLQQLADGLMRTRAEPVA
ncbi:HAD family hydrolase [Dyella psychrodurans]|uniref:HAD family hydrolase n=1 Tax=Dyella psychrodurans TaxID=1927960 RepID=A0A370XF06_9GAMM|nr:HAD family hydrolase [Dyella psychrodurans]